MLFKVLNAHIFSPFWRSVFLIGLLLFLIPHFSLLAQEQVKVETHPQSQIHQSKPGFSQTELIQKSDLKNNYVNAQIEVNSFNYNSSFDATNANDSAKQENIFHLELDAKKQLSSKFFSEKINFRASALFDKDLNRQANESFAVPEFYFSTHLNNKGLLTLGRVLSYQSLFDTRFNLGLVHPYYTLDQIRFRPQGLTGAEWDQEFSLVPESKFKLFLGVYPIYIPSQEPTVSFKNNKTVAQNRWSPSLPEQLSLGENKLPLNYELQSYRKSQIANNTTYRLGSELSSGFYKLFVGFKRGPTNTVSIQRETFTNVELTEARVRIGPKVNYSNQLQVDSQVVWGNLSFKASYLKDQPDSIKAESQQTIQKLSNIEAQAFSVELNQLELSGLEQTLFLSYANIQNGHIQDIDDQNQADLLTFSRRRQIYFKPLRLGFLNQFYVGLARPLKLQTTYTYDSVQKGSLLNSRFEYDLNNTDNFKINFGLDVLGAETSEIENSDFFLSKFQSNDRFYGGLSYVF